MKTQKSERREKRRFKAEKQFAPVGRWFVHVQNAQIKRSKKNK